MYARPTSTGRLTQPPVEHWVERHSETSTPFAEEDAARLASLYWRAARRGVFGLVRSAGPALGPVALRAFWAGGPVLIRMGAAVVAIDDERVDVSFPILDGVVVGAAGGYLRLAAERTAGVQRLGVRVEDYTPRLYGARRILPRLAAVPYGLAQSRVHDRVTTVYLRTLERYWR